jgi:murein DD-endopeptidase MepM/ murein hydrolase activator NlpD
MQNPNKPGQWGFVWHSYIDQDDTADEAHPEDNGSEGDGGTSRTLAKYSTSGTLSATPDKLKNVLVYEQLGWQYPLPSNMKQISAGFLQPSYYNEWGRDHWGIDIFNANGQTSGQAVKAPAAGKVIRYGTSAANTYPGCGNCVGVETNDIDPATGRKLCYMVMHLQDPPTKALNATVAKGDTLGYVGNTSGDPDNPYAYHLHFQVCNNGQFLSGSPTRTRENQINPIYFFPNITFAGYTTIYY